MMELILILVIVGVFLWGLRRLSFIDADMKLIITVLIVIAVLVYLYRHIGALGL